MDEALVKEIELKAFQDVLTHVASFFLEEGDKARPLADLVK